MQEEMSVAELKVKCNRKIWVAASLGIFILLGQWRCLVAKGNFSLFGGMKQLTIDLLQLVRAGDIGVNGIIRSLIPAVIWTVVYAAVSVGVGWVVGAVISFAIALVRGKLPKSPS